MLKQQCFTRLEDEATQQSQLVPHPLSSERARARARARGALLATRFEGAFLSFHCADVFANSSMLLTSSLHRTVLLKPPLSGQAADAMGIDTEYALRMRSLLSVDDLVLAVHDVLQSYGEWENTFVLYSSDHGYSLGQYKNASHYHLILPAPPPP